MIWLGSELMFFSGLFAAYFTIRAHCNVAVAPLDGEHLDYVQAGIFSVVLLVSSPTFQMGVWAQERGERRKARDVDRDELPPGRRLPGQHALRVARLRRLTPRAVAQRLLVAVLHHDAASTDCTWPSAWWP